MSVIANRRALLLASNLRAPTRGPSIASLSSTGAVGRDTRTRTMYYDSHLHVWAAQEDAESGLFPYAGALVSGGAGKEPPMPGHAEVLLQAMKEASVSGALIIQPGNHKFNHSYVTSVLKAHPDKFAGMLLANPTEEAGLEQLTMLVKEDGYKGVRFNPCLWPEGESMTNSLGRAMYQRAGELGVPVGHMTFKGLLNHIHDITSLCEEFPDTKVIIDHFGFCSAAEPDGEDWKALYALSRFPQVYVKVSAFFRVSAEDYPYKDTRAPLRQLISTFGPQRLMWGSDFPWVTEKCGYVKSWNVVAEDEDFFSAEEREWIMGRTFLSLFPELESKL